MQSTIVGVTKHARQVVSWNAHFLPRATPPAPAAAVVRPRSSCRLMSSTTTTNPTPGSADSSSSTTSSTSTDSSSSSSSSSSQPPPKKKRNYVYDVLGAAFGIALAVKFSTFLDAKFVNPEKAAERRAAGRPANAAPFPHIKIAPMSADSHTLPQIFESFTAPLVDFDTVAEEFIERKDVVQKRVDAMTLRRKTTNVPVEEVKKVEADWRRIESEERLRMQPRLEYLTQLYFVRSLELMQRAQMNAERRFALGKKSIASAEAAKHPNASKEDQARAQADAEEEKKVRHELDVEMEAYKKAVEARPILIDLVKKYNLKGTEATMRNEMQQNYLKSASSPQSPK